MVAKIKDAPVCQDKFPTGQKKIAKGDECEPDCPVGQTPKRAGDGCEPCGKGERPNAKGDKCTKNGDDDKKCAEGEAKTGAGRKCEPCAKDKKPTAGSDTCELKTGEDKKKDKETEEKNKRMKRAGFCLGFVAIALGGIEGVDLASDDGAALINAEAEIVVNERPGDVEFKDMVLGDSNIEPEVAQTAVAKRSVEGRPSTSGFRFEPIFDSKSRHKRFNNANSIPKSAFTPTFLVTHSPKTSSLSRRKFPPPGAVIKAASGTSSVAKAGKGAIAKAGKGVIDNAIKTGKAFQSPKQEASNPAKINSQVGKNTKPPAKPAKMDEKLKTIKDNKSFKDYLGLAAVSTVGAMALHTGFEVPYSGFKAEEKAMVLTIFTNEDNNGGKEATVQTYNDDFFHPDRLQPEECTPFAGPYQDSISGYDVKLGCCIFYRDVDCKNSLFAASNREHADLQGDSNDSITSFACTFDPDCKGLPP